MIESFEELFNRTKQFCPVAGFYPAMDMVCILSEDVSYRSDYFGPALSVLLDPQEDRVIGFNVSWVNFLVAFSLESDISSKEIPLTLLKLTRLAALASWPTSVPERRKDIFAKIDAYYADGRNRNLALTRHVWNSRPNPT